MYYGADLILYYLILSMSSLYVECQIDEIRIVDINMYMTTMM
jgi:hypothetical protein